MYKNHRGCGDYAIFRGFDDYAEKLYDKYSKITILDQEFDDREFKYLKEAIDTYEGQAKTATPYITKVVNHWYRNQYFIGIENDISSQKQRVRKMINNICTIIIGEQQGTSNADGNNGNNTDIDLGELENIKRGCISSVDNYTTVEELQNYIPLIETAFVHFATNQGIDEERIKKIKDECEATKQELETVISGSAYEIKANPEPFWYDIPDGAILSDNNTVANFLKQMYVKETRTADLIQKHNPLFEDNSQYIRNWLRDKYYIYDGTKKEEEQRMAEGKGYIQGKTALQALETMISECEDRENIVYTQRDLKELFEDFEFDLENTQVTAQKVLTNVMPAYIPYTQWPSVFEKMDLNCTKMIYKTTGTTNIVAPANGIITRAGNNFIEIEFTGEEENTNFIEGMILHIEAEHGSLSGIINENKTIERNSKIANASPSNGMIILNLRLISPTKQPLKIEDYMKVEKIQYSTNISDYEKRLLYNLQEKEINVKLDDDDYETGIFEGESFTTTLKRASLMNTVFNKILSPYYPEYRDISSVLKNAETAKKADYIKFAENYTSEGNLSEFEENGFARGAIINALAGIDYTKKDSLYGATRYFGDDEYYKELNLTTSEQDEYIQKREDLKIKIVIGDRTFGISEEEYVFYLGEMLGKKLDEVIYTLNREKYVHGIEELYEKFESVKQKIIKYYEDGKFIEDCSSTEQPEGATTVVEVVKSNISQEEKENEDKTTKTVTDKFTLTVNSNYVVVWSWTYEIGEEGKIITTADEIELTCKPIVNY